MKIVQNLGLLVFALVALLKGYSLFQSSDYESLGRFAYLVVPALLVLCASAYLYRKENPYSLLIFLSLLGPLLGVSLAFAASDLINTRQPAFQSSWFALALLSVFSVLGSLPAIWLGYRGKVWPRAEKILGFLSLFWVALGSLFVVVLAGAGGAHGRRFRTKREPETAAIEEGDSWSATGISTSEALNSELRRQLGKEWEEDAKMEHASIAAFARLSLELMSLGAPPELLTRVHRAASDEIRHAQACFSLASFYAQEQVTAAAFPQATQARGAVTLSQLVTESIEDGCLMEGFAAECAREAQRLAKDPTIRAVLASIAEEEAQHAALSWDLVRWALSREPEVIARVLAEAAQRLPQTLSLPQSQNDLSQYGRLTTEAKQGLFVLCRREVIGACAVMVDSSWKRAA